MAGGNGSSIPGNGHHIDGQGDSLPAPVPSPGGAGASPGPISAPAGKPKRQLTEKQKAALDAGRKSFKPGQVTNPLGTPMNLPNLNKELNEIFRAPISKDEKKSRLEKIVDLSMALAIKGHSELLLKLIDKGLVTITPEAAGVVINNTPQANANAGSYEVMLTQVQEARAAALAGHRPGMGGDEN